MGVHEENIRPLIRKVSDNTYNNKITVRTAYCKSVNNKIDEMLLTIYDEEIGVSMLTETWITDETILDELEKNWI